MTEIVFEKPKQIPFNRVRMQKQSTATVRYLIDSIVELVTNSDDSYKSLGLSKSKKYPIIIKVIREKGGKTDTLEVLDNASGMDKQGLEKALEFAGETSGFFEGQSVRGLFGRGLKEVIIALGKAEIYSIKNNELSIAKIWFDTNKGLMYELVEKTIKANLEWRKKIGIEYGNGTSIKIKVLNDKITCPTLKTFKTQVENNFSLREINSDESRRLILIFESKDPASKTEKIISYKYPEGKLILEDSYKIPASDDELKIKIFESDVELESPYNDPQARAGLLIKTTGAVLDNQLFRYQNDTAGKYFYGEVICDGIAKKIRENDWGIINTDRTGINWRHQYCAAIKQKVENILSPIIEKKKKQLEVKPSMPRPEKTVKMLNKLCSLLNKFAKDELSDVPQIDIDPGDEELTEFTIIPKVANIEIDEKKGYGERIFSVYAPKSILELPLLESYNAKAKSDNTNIKILNPTIKLSTHKKYPEKYFFGIFRVTGELENEESLITCTLLDNSATAIARVTKEKKRKKRRKPPKRGGFFREILADNRENPDQRASYDEDNGIIRIFIKFPVINKYLDDSLSPKSPESKTMLAELLGEVYCKFTAREKIEKGTEYITLTDPVDTFNRAVNDLQKKYLHLIHDLVTKYEI